MKDIDESRCGRVISLKEFQSAKKGAVRVYSRRRDGWTTDIDADGVLKAVYTKPIE